MPKRTEATQTSPVKKDEKEVKKPETGKKTVNRDVPPATKKESPEHKKVMELVKEAGVTCKEVEERMLDVPDTGKRNAVFMQFESGVQGVKDMLYTFHTTALDYTGWWTEVVDDDILAMYHA